MRVAIKFCGGCDPTFDRLAYFEKLKIAAGDQIVWVAIDQRPYAAILLIAGCQTACPETEMPKDLPLVTVTSDRGDLEETLQGLLKGRK